METISNMLKLPLRRTPSGTMDSLDLIYLLQEFPRRSPRPVFVIDGAGKLDVKVLKMLVQLLRKNMTERNALSDALDVMSADEVRALVRRGSSPSVDSDVSSTVVDTYESSGSLPTADVTPGEEMAILLTSMLTPRASDAMVGDARPQLRTMLLNVTATVISTPAANDRPNRPPHGLTRPPSFRLSGSLSCVGSSRGCTTRRPCPCS